jgi:hypothetical protein
MYIAGGTVGIPTVPPLHACQAMGDSLDLFTGVCQGGAAVLGSAGILPAYAPGRQDAGAPRGCSAILVHNAG